MSGWRILLGACLLAPLGAVLSLPLFRAWGRADTWSLMFVNGALLGLALMMRVRARTNWWASASVTAFGVVAMLGGWRGAVPTHGALLPVGIVIATAFATFGLAAALGLFPFLIGPPGARARGD